MNKSISNIYDVTVKNSSIADIEASAGTAREVLTFSSTDRQSGMMMHTNYPEFLENDSNGIGKAFAENGYCTNRQTYGPGKVQVFFSHHNKTGKNMWYGVHVFNGNTGVANVKILNWGFSTGFSNAATPVYQYFDTTTQSQNIASNGSWWVLQQQIPANASGSYTPFWGVVTLEVSQPVIITTYAYKNISSLTGTEIPYPRGTAYSSDIAVLSGYGDGYHLKKTININVSDLKDSNGDYKDYWYYTGEHGAWGRNNGELTPIHIVGTNLIATPESTNDTLNQLGNWSTLYDFTVNITNNTNTAKTVYGFISGNSAQSYPVIKTDSDIKAWLALTDKTKRWFQETIPANTTYTYKFSYMQASYGAPATMHAWSLSSTLA